MPGPLLSTFLLSPGGIIVSLFFCAAGITLTIYDLIKKDHQSKRGQQSTWYERPLIWLGGNGIAIGLIMLLDRMFLALPGSSSTNVFFVVFFIICLLDICTGLCSLIALSPNKNRRNARSRNTRAGYHYGSSIYSFVQENPLLAQARMLLILHPFLCLMAIWGMCGTLFLLVANQLFFSCVSLSLGLLTFWCIKRTFVQLRWLKHIEHLRVEIVRRTRFEGASPMLVFPIPGFAQPIMPAILLRQTWWGLGYGTIYGLALGSSITQSLTHLAVRLPAILLTAGLIVFLRFRLRSRIEATWYGVSRGENTPNSNITWQEARLFVCYKLPGLFFERKNTVIYELSGPAQVVQWTRVLEAHSPFATWQPVLPMDQYQQQMQRLCEMITEKTGLKLHDLDETEPIMLNIYQEQK
jgi:hypothetical protein